MKLGIFGGTFDPIHAGHITLARHAQNQFHLDKILFIPAFIPPHKAANRMLTPAPYRYRMVEIAIAGNPYFEISSAELNRAELSYTVDTLRKLKEEHPLANLFLIVGEDSLSDFSTWRDPAEIKKMAGLLVAPREGSAHKFAADQTVQWIHMPVCPFSSSMIRKRIQEGSPVGDMLPPGVEDYIQTMHLYGKK